VTATCGSSAINRSVLRRKRSGRDQETSHAYTMLEVDAQDGDRCSTARRAAKQPGTSPPEVRLPFLAARVKQPHHPAAHRVDAAQVARAEKIAQVT